MPSSLTTIKREDRGDEIAIPTATRRFEILPADHHVADFTRKFGAARSLRTHAAKDDGRVAAVRRRRVADHFEETIGLRVAALEAQQAALAAEAESVKQHFAELREFITFTVTTQLAPVKVDLRRLEQRFEALEQKMDAHHDAMKVILSDILSRLPAKHG